MIDTSVSLDEIAHLTCLTSPRHAERCLAVPRLPRHAVPGRTPPGHAPPAAPCNAPPCHASPRPVSPRLPCLPLLIQQAE